MRWQRNRMRPWTVLACLFALVSSACELDPETPHDGGGRACTGLTLPAGSFFPEGIALGPGGDIAVASAGTGAVVVFEDGASEDPTELVAVATPEIANAIGIRYDETADLYWVCSVSFEGLGTGRPGGRLVGVSPDDGSVTVVHPLDEGALCNDIAVSATHGVFATDSMGSQLWNVPRASVLAAGSAAVWSAEAAFDEGRAAGGLSLNGIVIDEAASAIYTARLDTGALFRIALERDGRAGAVETITVDGDLTGADGLTLEATAQLLVIQNGTGELDRVAISGSHGTVTSVATGLEEPATGVIDGADLLVTFTRFSQLFGGATPEPTRPFCVGRIPLGS